MMQTDRRPCWWWFCFFHAGKKTKARTTKKPWCLQIMSI